MLEVTRGDGKHRRGRIHVHVRCQGGYAVLLYYFGSIPLFNSHVTVAYKMIRMGEREKRRRKIGATRDTSNSSTKFVQRFLHGTYSVSCPHGPLSAGGWERVHGFASVIESHSTGSLVGPSLEQ